MICKALRNGSVLLAAGLVCLSFLGCGQSRPSAGAGSASGSAVTSAALVRDSSGSGGIELPISPTPVTYTAMISEQASAPFRDSFVVFPELEKRTGIHIEPILVIDSSYNDKLSVTLASGDIPDYISNVTPTIANQYGPKGLFLNSWKYIDQMPNMKWCFDTFDGWDAYKYSDNELYQLLVQCSPDSDPQGFGYYRQIPMIRIDVLEELNLQTPKTFDELHDVLTAIKKAYPGSYPWLSEVGTNSSPLQALIEQMLIAWSGDLFSFDNYYTVYDTATRKWSFALERPGFKELIQYLATAYKEGLLDPEFVRMRGPQWEERMLNNRGFFSYAYWNNSDNITLKGIENGNRTFKVMGFLPPIKDGKSAAVVRQVCNSTVAISAKVKNPETFMQFIDYWLYSKDGTMLSNAGIPEVNWTWDIPEKVYKLLDPDRPNPTNETHKEKYGVRYGNMTGLRPDHLDIHGWVGNPDTDIYYQQQLVYKGHGINPAPIVILHDDEDADAIKQIGQPILDYVEQRLTRIVTGTDDISTYDSIIQECKRIGSDQLVEILNK